MKDYVHKRNWYMKFNDDTPYANVHYLFVGLAEAPAHAGARTISNLLQQFDYKLKQLPRGK